MKYAATDHVSCLEWAALGALLLMFAAAVASVVWLIAEVVTRWR